MTPITQTLSWLHGAPRWRTLNGPARQIVLRDMHGLMEERLDRLRRGQDTQEVDAFIEDVLNLRDSMDPDRPTQLYQLSLLKERLRQVRQHGPHYRRKLARVKALQSEILADYRKRYLDNLPPQAVGQLFANRLHVLNNDPHKRQHPMRLVIDQDILSDVRQVESFNHMLSNSPASRVLIKQYVNPPASDPSAALPLRSLLLSHGGGYYSLRGIRRRRPKMTPQGMTPSVWRFSMAPQHWVVLGNRSTTAQLAQMGRPGERVGLVACNPTTLATWGLPQTWKTGLLPPQLAHRQGGHRVLIQEGTLLEAPRSSPLTSPLQVSVGDDARWQIHHIPPENRPTYYQQLGLSYNPTTRIVTETPDHQRATRRLPTLKGLDPVQAVEIVARPAVHTLPKAPPVFQVPRRA